MPSPQDFINIIRRHPQTSAFDLVLAILAISLGVGFAFTYDLAELWSEMPPREQMIADEELAALAILVFVCVSIFVWRRILEERQDRERWERTEQELIAQRSLANADALTALPNRREFLRVLDAEIARNQPFSLLLLDLNGFKAINDQYGHATGDDVLKAVAARFRHAARAQDLVARLGGDEFVVVAESMATHQQAREIGKRFTHSLQNGIDIKGHSHHVRAAIGMATWPEDGATAAALIAHADATMYLAKRAMRAASTSAAECQNVS